MERKKQETEGEGTQCETSLISSAESFQIDETILHHVLYGKWPAWNGQRPPEKVRQQLLQHLPKGILKNIPQEVYLDVSTLTPQELGIFASTTIEERTVIGPLPGSLVDPSSSAKKTLDKAWEVVDKDGLIKSFLQMEHCEETKDAWMAFIQPARHIQEQNLETSDAGGAIYYRVTKDIYAGEELLVWYGLHIEQCFGIPCFESQKTHKHLEITGAAEEERKKLSCVICHKGFNSRSNLRSHMRTHTQQKPFRCNVCCRRFSQSSTLRNHTRLHTGEKPYKCSTCRSAYSQLAGLRAHQKSSQHQPKLYSADRQSS